MKKTFILVSLILVTTMLLPKVWDVNVRVFKVWFPDDWKISKTEKVILKATSPAGDFVCQFNYVAGMKTLDDAAAKKLQDALVKEMAQRFNGFTPTQGLKSGAHKNFKIYTFKGKVNNKGLALDLGFALLSSGKHVVIMSTTTASANAGKYKDIGGKVFDSLTFD